jgi:hypothetical protein
MRYKDFFVVLMLCCVLGCSEKENPVSDGNNSAPEILAVTFIPDTIVAGESCLIQVKAVDPDSDNLSYEWESVGSIAGSGAMVIFSPGSCCAAPWLFLTVKDGKGGVTDSAVQLPFIYE